MGPTAERLWHIRRREEMNFAPLYSVIRRTAAAVAVIFLAALIGVGGPPQAVTSVVTFHPAVSDFQFITASETPPTQAQCASVGRRCFNATAMQNSYNLGPLYGQGLDGQGITIGIVDRSEERRVGKEGRCR